MEADGAVECDRFRHARERVEADARVPAGARFRDEGGGEAPPEAGAARLRTDVEALGLADVGTEGPQRRAAHRTAAVAGEQQPASRRGVVARKAGQLGLEALEAEVDAERVRVLAEQRPDLGQILLPARRLDPHHRGGTLSPIPLQSAAMSEQRPGPGPAFESFVALIARLRAPGGCPWDREQTHRSLKPMTIEEAYEVLEAIDRGDDEHLAAELGDLLLQVVFHAQIAADEGRFDIAQVLERIADKMVRRHPHVFGTHSATTPGEVLRNWEALKRAERQEKGHADASLLDGVSASLPSVLEAYQISVKAARVGFDWPDAEAVLAKLDEEGAELKAAVRAKANPSAVAEEIGDLLFAAVNVARLLGEDPESCLKAANRKFRARFRHVEERLKERGRTPGESNLAEMEALWQEAKAKER
jgi:MazG family protein